MRVLVTGATGFLGNNLCRILIGQGHQAIAAVRPTSNRDALNGFDVEVVSVNFNEPASIASALENVDAVVHAAALIHVGWTKLEESREANVGNTIRMARACRRKGIRMVFVSSVDALGQGTESSPTNENQLDPPKPACSYVVSKREAETAFLLEVAAGLDGVIVNPSFMVGPYDWKPSSGEMMLMVYRTFLFYVPGGGCSVADVRDVAAGIVSAIENGVAGQRYILGGENITYFELWTRMAKVIGCGGPKRKLRNVLANSIGWVCDQYGNLVGKELVVNSATMTMGQNFNWNSSEKAQRELGYQIGSVDDALADAWDWFVANGYTNK
jgi:dihydroflavonol-4-reductase